MPTTATPSRSEPVVVQYGVARRGLPSARTLRRWARAAWRTPAAITLRIVGAAEARRLNRQFRGKDAPTNVLSFPYGKRCGDLVLCHPVIAREARAQGKSLPAHYAHMVVHGMLHLQGHDHLRRAQARRMETREVRVLRRLGYPDPYTLE